MKKSFFIHCTGLTPKQAGAFGDVIQDFFDEMTCGGRSHASFEWIDIRKRYGSNDSKEKESPLLPPH